MKTNSLPVKRYNLMKRVVNWGGSFLALCDTWALLKMEDNPALSWAILVVSSLLGILLFEWWTAILETMTGKDD